MNIALNYAAKSDVGLVRSNNQDSAFAGPHLLAVCDGMGGHAGGDVASSLAIANLAPLDDDVSGSDDMLEDLEEAIRAAASDLAERVQEEPDLDGMGTTVTALLRAGNKLAMAHIGDSRAYLLRDGTLNAITTDHTLVQHWVSTGKLTEEEAESHPHRNVVLRVLTGQDLDVRADTSIREALVGDRWLLCSDGLSGYVSHDTIHEVLNTVKDPQAAVDDLIDYALRAGGPDNITAIVADVVDLDALPDGTAPSTTSIVVGSAATTRHEPTSAGKTPASKAAALIAPKTYRTPEEEIETVISGPRRRSWVRGVLTTFVILAVLAGGLFGGYRWTQAQYYLGIDDGHVAIYQGIPQSVGPVSLSHVVERTDTATDQLPPYIVDRLSSGIMSSSRADAERRYEELIVDLVPTPTPTPTDTVQPDPDDTPGPDDTEQPTPDPTDEAGDDS